MAAWVRRGLLLATALLATGTPAAARTVDRTCATRGVTIAATSAARAFRAGRTVYACLYGHRPLSITRYSPPGPATSVIQVALSGRYAAASRYEFAPPLGFTTLKVVDVLKRRIVSQPSASTTQSRDIRVSDIVLKGRSLAWIVSLVHIDSSTGQMFFTYEVHRVDRTGASVLDSGRNVVSGSLGLSFDGRRMYWMDAGSPHTAALR